MSLNSLKLSIEYGTLVDDVAKDFYIPVLEEGIVFKRAVGFFSSTVLLNISKGLCSFAKKNGKMKLLISSRLDIKDYEAIKEGYDLKKLVQDKLINDFNEFEEFEQKDDRYGLLSYMISNNILDIKVVVLEQNNDDAMFHEKLGLVIDEDNNIVCFTGGMNDSNTAINKNYDHIDVFSSWASNDSYQRCVLKDMRFDRMWDGVEKGILTIEFPEILKEKILSFGQKSTNYFNVDKELIEKIKQKKYEKNSCPTMSKIKGLYDYQLKAINNWKINNYRGIFDMATGTGKTYTGFGAINQLYIDKEKLFVLICCPYIHLVEQWCDEAQNFDINPIKCYGNIDYKEKLKRAIYKFKREKKGFYCAIFVNKTFSSDYVQTLVSKISDSTMLLVDEAHNFGANKLSECLEVDYKYRLALSATLERFGDEEGTKKLLDYFGTKCIQYDLGMAIEQRKLTPYYYYPVIVTLDDEELYEYVTLTSKITKLAQINTKSEQLKKLLLKRARLIASTKSKIQKLKELLDDKKSENNMLIYCGAVRYGDSEYDEAFEDKKQIDVVSKVLRDLNIKYSKFTAEEDPPQRRAIIDAFKNENIQSLVAIKCLDEGMNIPAIKTAYILASSTNPKEYIQRRGRVLRTSPGKNFAYIYDFIALPYDLNYAKSLNSDSLHNVIGLVKRELTRVIDFNNLSFKPINNNEVIDEIKSAYKLNVVTISEGDIYE